jgi:hypothetical protein
MKQYLMRIEDIDDVFFATSQEQPHIAHYTFFYVTKNKDKEWNFSINLN